MLRKQKRKLLKGVKALGKEKQGCKLTENIHIVLYVIVFCVKGRIEQIFSNPKTNYAESYTPSDYQSDNNFFQKDSGVCI